MNSKLIVLSGFSGAGKSSLSKKIVEMYPDDYALSISATTRKKRNGEEEGKSYFFKTVEEFTNMINNSEFLEYANYVGNFYGTPKAYVDEKLQNGKNVILEIEIQGANQIKKVYPDAIFIFISTIDATTLLNRLNKRGTNTKDDIRNRIKRAICEAEGINLYDYIIINNDFEESIFFS